MFVGPHTPHSVTQNLNQKFGVPLTDDLGMYLGHPIIHGRTRTSLYEFILAKVRKKSGWKMKTLFRVKRLILIQTVASTQPYYAMQITKLPCGFLDDMESLYCKSFWGEAGNQRKIQPISWDVICVAKENGGLGVNCQVLAPHEHCIACQISIEAYSQSKSTMGQGAHTQIWFSLN